MRIPAALQDTAATLGLWDWVQRKDFPLKEYCRTIDDLGVIVLRHQPRDEAFDPAPDQLVPTLAEMLNHEGALIEHALANAYAIHDDAQWLKVCRAAAFQVIRRYELALERGEWVP